MIKSYLFLMRSYPHGGIRVQETLDMILTAAAMDRSVSLLFLDEGVFQLLHGQAPEALGCKHIAPIFQALPIYDVESFWIEAESLEERGVAQRQLILPAKSIARDDVARLIENHDIVVSC